MSRRKWAYVLTVCTLLWVEFIWGHSIVPGDSSKAESMLVLDIANQFLTSIGINYQLSLFMIRKLAHFTEYFILGSLLLTTLRLYVDKIKEKIFNILFIGLFVPVVDEFIQLFIDGRGGEISDVIIDFSGVLCGIVITYALISLVLKIYNKKINGVEGR